MASQETATSTGDATAAGAAMTDTDVDVDMSESQISETQQTNMTVDSSFLNTPTTAIFPGKRGKGDDDDGSAWLGSFWQVEGWEPDHLKQLEQVAQEGYTKETQWPILQTLLKTRIKQNLASFLLTSFPRARARARAGSSSALDRRLKKKQREDDSRILAPATQHPGNMEGGSMDSFIMDDTEDEEGGVRRFYSSDDEDDDDQDDEDEEGSRTLDESGMTRRRTRKKTYGPEDLVPSTQGGLVIPPFPPLRSRGREGHRDQDQDPNSSASNPGQTAGGPSNSGTGRSFGMTAGRPPLGPRSNSGPYQPPVHQPLSSGFSSGSGGTSGTAGDPTYDQEAAIGGKVLGGKVRPREAEGLLEGIWRLIDEFERDPPFTVQRLCELAVHPRRQHTLLGKYVRALERVLLVTSPFEFPPDRDEHDEGVSGVQPGTDRPGVPPGLALERPLFGLIPFLQPQDGEMAVMPGTSAAAAVGGGATSGMDMGVESSSSSSSFSSSGLPPSGPIESTPTEPFLGRVDELDAGPLIKPSTDPTMVGGTSSQDPHQLHDVKEGGGGVILHGVSDRPRAISSTTDLTGLEGATHQMRGGYRQGMGKNGKTDSDDDSDSDDQPRLGDGDISDTSSTSSLFSSTSPSGRSAGNGRRISRLPRTSSTQSLTDRFVSTGMEVLDPAKEEEVRLSKDGGRTGSGGPDAGHGIKVENDDAIKLEIEDGNEDKKEVGVKDDVELKREEKEDEKTGLPVKIRRVE